MIIDLFFLYICIARKRAAGVEAGDLLPDTGKKKLKTSPLWVIRETGVSPLLAIQSPRITFKGFLFGLMSAILTVTDHADPTVGLFPESWEVQCPFEDPEYPDADKSFPDKVDYAVFKASIISAYSQFATGKVSATYEWESIKLSKLEIPCT